MLTPQVLLCLYLFNYIVYRFIITLYIYIHINIHIYYIYRMQISKCPYGTQPNHQRDLQSHSIQQSPKKQLKFNRQAVIKKQLLKITDLYDIHQKIGSGSFGQVYKIIHKQLKITRALKIFNKSTRNPTSNPYQEVNILKQLDHPNVLKIYQYFQTESSYQVVTEYFQGKELFDVIIDDKGISERKAAIIFAEICKALAYVHAHDIVHRDIKPENILVKKENDEEYTIKLIDWGLGSKAVKELARRCGTPEYCAPEVIKGRYGKQCDLWSLGTVLYVMLIGKYPFKGETREQTLTLIAKAHFSFKDPEWNKISTQAKMIISKLMKKNPDNRIKASQCLSQPWILKNLKKQKETQVKLAEALDRLKQINFQNKFQAIAINFIQNYVQTSQQTLQLRKQFEYLDQNKDGVLSYQQLRKGYTRVYGQIQAQKIVQNIFTQIDIDCSNKIQYSQFVAFGTKITQQFSKQQLKQAFRSFDQNQDGKINKSQLNSLLSYQRGTQSQDFQQILNQIDKDKDGCIDIDQFVQSVNKAVQTKLANEGNNEKKSTRGKQLYEDLAQNLLESFKTNKLRRISFSTLSNITQKQEKQEKQSKIQL